MASAGRVDFDGNSQNVAYSCPDGPMRIWEVQTGILKDEFLPIAHLSAVCTCLRWRPKCDKLKDTKHKKAKKNVENSRTDLDEQLLAVGSSTGTIHLYNASKGDVHTQLDYIHSSSITGLCWSEDSSYLFSCSQDGLIVLWDIKSLSCKHKWKASKPGLSSIQVCGSGRLITASRSITVWDLTTFAEVKNFTGHATNVVQLHCISSEEADISSLYIVSVAQNDRVISVWKPDSSPKCKRALASFVLSGEPLCTSVYQSEGSNIVLAALTIDGIVELFEHTLNGHVKRPIGILMSLRINSPSQKTLPVLAVSVISQRQLIVMYGGLLSPAFESLDFSQSSNEQGRILVRADPRQSAPVTRVTSVGNVRQPKVVNSEVTTLTPAVESGRRMAAAKPSAAGGDKRRLDTPEASMEERLALIRASTEKVSSSGPMESFATQLTQGLQSGDSVILTKTLQTSDIKVINNTLRRLPPHCVVLLLKHLTTKLEASGSGNQEGAVAHTAMIRWVRSLLHTHTSYLATFPALMEKLQRMYSIMENRAGQLSTFARLQGRLELMLSQIARQKDSEDTNVAATALLTLQDESSEDEMLDVDMLGARSESEDGYLSADEDDLMKA